MKASENQKIFEKHTELYKTSKLSKSLFTIFYSVLRLRFRNLWSERVFGSPSVLERALKKINRKYSY
jgi:hypothetical protein